MGGFFWMKSRIINIVPSLLIRKAAATYPVLRWRQITWIQWKFIVIDTELSQQL
jgi:hypothetical protein